MKITDIIRKTEFIVITATVALLPLMFFSKFANVIETSKIAFLVLALLIVLTLKAARAIIDNSIGFNSSKFDVPVFLLATIYIVSAFLETPNKMEAVFLPGTATIVVSSALLFFFINQLRQSQKEIIFLSLFGSATVYSLIVLLTAAGLFSAIPQLPQFMKSPGFTTLGSPLSGIILLASAAPVGVFVAWKERNVAHKALAGVSLALMLFAVILGIVNLIPGGATPLRVPSLQTSWSIAIEAIKSKPLLGVGPGNYLTAFNRFRPIEYNATDLWSVRFTTGRSYLFTLITETGITGLAAFSLLIFSISRMFKKDMKINAGLASLGIATIALLAFPTSITVIVAFFTILAINAKEQKREEDGIFAYEGRESKLPILVITVPVLLLVVAAGYYLTKIAYADMLYKSAIVKISEGDGSMAYEGLQNAINRNPYVDRYRVSYAQINLAIANSLVSQEEISEEDRNTIAQLVQQAIREGKAAVALNPTRASNWETLASIYRAVAPLAEGATNFSAQTYAQAISLDPYNPITRVSLGGIFYSAGQFEDAIDQFTSAVRVKPDHANARYNLAIAFKDNGQIDQAINEISQVLTLVDRDSEDYELVSNTLDELRSEKANADTSGSTDNLVPPEGTEPALDPQLELPVEAEPPAPEPEETTTEPEPEVEEETEEPQPEETPAP